MSPSDREGMTCPPPPEHADCPLYGQRLDYGQDEPLRRAVLMERHRAGLADLVRAEALRPAQPPAQLLPAPESAPHLFFEHQKKGTRHE